MGTLLDGLTYQHVSDDGCQYNSKYVRDCADAALREIYVSHQEPIPNLLISSRMSGRPMYFIAANNRDPLAADRLHYHSDSLRARTTIRLVRSALRSANNRISIHKA